MRSCAYALAAVLATVLVTPPAPAVAAPGRPTAVHSAAAASQSRAAVYQPRAAVSQPRAAAGPVVVARYGFDGGRAALVPDDTGHGHTMRLVSRNGGTVTRVTHGPGFGMQFPRRCSGGACPKAILQSPHSADLNPGARSIAFGAAVRLARSQTTSGQNVLQKGYSASGSQYKLQIDGSAGRPSCVLVGTRTSIKLVRSSVSVADGVWHAVYCVRVGTVFRIVVDGVVRGTIRVPSGLSVANSRPLSIGGKGVYSDNDQFHGALDDVWVKIG
jgi:hypothetical protein